MMSARAQFLGAGHYKPLADALVAFARDCPLPGNLVLEVGAGTAYYLAHIVDASAERAGLAVDLSRYAARRAAKANPRIASVVGDVWDRLPVADEASGLTIDVFAPRQPAELSRTLHRGGTLVVVTRSRSISASFGVISACSGSIRSRRRASPADSSLISDCSRNTRSPGRCS